MIRMSPTALAIRYLDSRNRWLELEPDMRDKALKYIEEGKHWIETQSNNHYGEKVLEGFQKNYYSLQILLSSSQWLFAINQLNGLVKHPRISL